MFGRVGIGLTVIGVSLSLGDGSFEPKCLLRALFPEIDGTRRALRCPTKGKKACRRDGLFMERPLIVIVNEDQFFSGNDP